MNIIFLLPRLTELAAKTLWRHKLRTILTLGGVTAGMFLYASVTALQNSLEATTKKAAEESSLVVFQANRFCPSTSKLPEHYKGALAKMKGVKAAYPVQVVVNNCGASLDVITFRGVSPEYVQDKVMSQVKLKAGSVQGWPQQGDMALVPARFAEQRGLSVGDSFEAAGIKAVVGAILETKRPEDAAVIWVPLPFLQQASNLGLGTVTQFELDLNSSEQVEPLAKEIDDLYATDQVPTHTRPRSAFFTDTAGQMIELVKFTHWLGVGAVLAVLGLLSNSALLAVRGRIKESAILQTLGWSRLAVSLLTLCEGALLGVGGGILGIGLCLCYFSFSTLTFGNEGVVLALEPDSQMVVQAFIVSLGLGLIATLWPAWVASRRPLADSLR